MKRPVPTIMLPFALSLVAWAFYFGRTEAWNRLTFWALFLTFVLRVVFSKEVVGTRRWTLAAAWLSGAILITGLVPRHLWKINRTDSNTGWRARPGLVNYRLDIGSVSTEISTDTHGCRIPAGTVLTNTSDIIVQGNSNVFGLGLAFEDSFSAQLEKMTGQRTSGCGGIAYDLNSYYFQWKDFQGRGVSPKHRVIFLGLGTDITMAVLATPYSVARPYLSITGETAEPVPARALPWQAYGLHFQRKFGTFDRKSGGFDFFTAAGSPALEVAPVAHLLSEWIALRGDPASLMVTTPESATDPAPAYYPDWLLLKRELWPQPFAEYFRDSKTIFHLLARQSVKPYIVLFPFKKQIVPLARTEAIKRLKKKGYSDSDMDPLSANKFLKSVFDKLGIIHRDCTDSLMNFTNPDSLYFLDNNHLTREGVAICTQLASQLFKTESR